MMSDVDLVGGIVERILLVLAYAIVYAVVIPIACILGLIWGILETPRWLFFGGERPK